MLRLTIQKELKAILLSPKFVVTLAICSVLILLSVYIGIQEYRQNLAQYQTATKLADQSLKESTSWADIDDRVFRRPEPLQIFSSGLNFDIGRWSEISQQELVKIRNSAYSDDPIFAVFRHLDFSIIVQVVLSLLAILFTFDAVSGELLDDARRAEGAVLGAARQWQVVGPAIEEARAIGGAGARRDASAFI